MRFTTKRSAYLQALDPPDHYLLGTAHIGRGVQFQFSDRLPESRREFESAIAELGRMTRPDHVKIAWAHTKHGQQLAGRAATEAR